MDFRKQKLSIEEVKSTDMVNYLSSIGHEPAKIRGNDYWYLSPLRHEKTPSFKVSRKLNRWYDHGIGKGGSLIDFAMLYHGYNLCEFLDLISVGPSFQKPITDRSEKAAEHENRIKVLGDFQITSFALLRYLEQRHIAIDVAEAYCREVRYELNDKVYYASVLKMIREALKFVILISKQAVRLRILLPIKTVQMKPLSLKDSLIFYPLKRYAKTLR